MELSDEHREPQGLERRHDGIERLGQQDLHVGVARNQRHDQRDVLDATRGDLDRFAVPGAGAGEITEQGGGIQAIQRTSQHQLGLADPGEQGCIEPGQVAETLGKTVVDGDAHRKPGDRLGVTDGDRDDFPGTVVQPG